MIDLDGFKAINDAHGHADGDRVLRNVAAGLRLAVRANDIVARYGGDEFVVLMPDTDLAAAQLVAERVVAGVRGQRHQLADGTEGSVACSAGLALYPDDGRTATRLLRTADAAMYRVKRAGGDAVSRERAAPGRNRLGTSRHRANRGTDVASGYRGSAAPPSGARPRAWIWFVAGAPCAGGPGTRR